MKSSRIWKHLIVFASLVLAFGPASFVNTTHVAAEDNEIVIVAFGDSLVAGYQLPPQAAFPVQLEKALKEKGYNARVMNAGVSGDTASDGLARFEWAMPDDADAVILELGANDSLRGIPVEETRKALDQILAKIKARGLPVLLAGMEAPRNWGEAYVRDFREMYKTLAQTYDAVFYPFFLDGVALDSSLNLGDGLHPNEDGVAEIVERIMPDVERLIERARADKTKES